MIRPPDEDNFPFPSTSMAILRVLPSFPAYTRLPRRTSSPKEDRRCPHEILCSTSKPSSPRFSKVRRTMAMTRSSPRIGVEPMLPRSLVARTSWCMSRDPSEKVARWMGRYPSSRNLPLGVMSPQWKWKYSLLPSQETLSVSGPGTCRTKPMPAKTSPFASTPNFCRRPSIPTMKCIGLLGGLSPRARSKVCSGTSSIRSYTDSLVGIPSRNSVPNRTSISPKVTRAWRSGIHRGFPVKRSSGRKERLSADDRMVTTVASCEKAWGQAHRIFR